MVLIPSSWRGNHQPNFHQVVAPRSYAPDIFEYVYLARRADSVIDGISVYDSRRQMGEALAQAVKNKLGPVVKTIDCIIPVPEGGYIGALESARTLGKPVSLGFVRNQHSCRTFIMPNQEQRLRGVRRKLSTVNAEFQGRNVLIIDDSIVRGTTSREIVAMARKAGARKVYLASLSPAIRYAEHPSHCETRLPTVLDLNTSTELTSRTKRSWWLTSAPMKKSAPILALTGWSICRYQSL